MPPNFGKATKRHIIALFHFIEGISIILKLRQLKLLQIEGWFARTPLEQFSLNSRISVFELQNSSNWRSVIWNIFLVLDITFDQLKLLQISSKLFVDAWKFARPFFFSKYGPFKGRSRKKSKSPKLTYIWSADFENLTEGLLLLFWSRFAWSKADGHQKSTFFQNISLFFVKKDKICKINFICGVRMSWTDPSQMAWFLRKHLHTS